jgi:hypothetical protein
MQAKLADMYVAMNAAIVAPSPYQVTQRDAEPPVQRVVYCEPKVILRTRLKDFEWNRKGEACIPAEVFPDELGVDTDVRAVV